MYHDYFSNDGEHSEPEYKECTSCNGKGDIEGEYCTRCDGHGSVELTESEIHSHYHDQLDAEADIHEE